MIRCNKKPPQQMKTNENYFSSKKFNWNFFWCQCQPWPFKKPWIRPGKSWNEFKNHEIKIYEKKKVGVLSVFFLSLCFLTLFLTYNVVLAPFLSLHCCLETKCFPWAIAMSVTPILTLVFSLLVSEYAMSPSPILHTRMYTLHRCCAPVDSLPWHANKYIWAIILIFCSTCPPTFLQAYRSW